MILHTQNGGISWERQESNTENSLTDVFFHDNQNGWIVGGRGIILQTKDGGKDWKRILVGESPDDYYHFFDIQFVDEQYGWITAHPRLLLRTTDGGDTWEQHFMSGVYTHISADFVNRLDGWMVTTSYAGGGGGIAFTNDGGLTWERRWSPTFSVFQSVTILNKNVVWLAGENGAIIYTTTGGWDL